MPWVNFTSFNYNSAPSPTDFVVGYSGSIEQRYPVSTIGGTGTLTYLTSSGQLTTGLGTSSVMLTAFDKVTRLAFNNCDAVGVNVLSQGEGTGVYADYGHAEGSATMVYGIASHSEGFLTNTTGDASHAEGFNTNAGGDYSHAEGVDSQAGGNVSHAEGEGTVSIGLASHSEGFQTQAHGNYSHSEGVRSYAFGSASHAEGNKSYAVLDASNTKGINNIAGIPVFFTNYLSSTRTFTITQLLSSNFAYLSGVSVSQVQLVGIKGDLSLITRDNFNQNSFVFPLSTRNNINGSITSSDPIPTLSAGGHGYLFAKIINPSSNIPCLVTGSENNSSIGNIVGGSGNICPGSNNLVVGARNSVFGSDNIVSGAFNIANSNNSIAAGGYNTVPGLSLSIGEKNIGGDFIYASYNNNNSTAYFKTENHGYLPGDELIIYADLFKTNAWDSFRASVLSATNSSITFTYDPIGGVSVGPLESFTNICKIPKKIQLTFGIVGGLFNTGTNDHNLTLGNTNFNTGVGSVVFGQFNSNVKGYSYVYGSGNTNAGETSFIHGTNNMSIGSYNFIVGNNNKSKGLYSNNTKFANYDADLRSLTFTSANSAFFAYLSGSYTSPVKQYVTLQVGGNTYIRCISARNNSNGNLILTDVSTPFDNNLNNVGVLKDDITNYNFIAGAIHDVYGIFNSVFGEIHNVGGNHNLVYGSLHGIVQANYCLIGGAANNVGINVESTAVLGSFSTVEEHTSNSLVYGTLNVAKGYSNLVGGSNNSINLSANFQSGEIFGSGNVAFDSVAGHMFGASNMLKGNYSVAGGYYAACAHDNSFIYKASSLTQHVSTTRNNQFMVSASGGVYMPGSVGIGIDTMSTANSATLHVRALSGIIFTNLPTASASLPAGGLWNNNGVLCIRS